MTFDLPVPVVSPDIQTRREETREDLTEEDLEQAVSHPHLTETPHHLAPGSAWDQHLQRGAGGSHDQGEEPSNTRR